MPYRAVSSTSTGRSKRARPFSELVTAFFFVLTFTIKAFVDDAFMQGDVSSAIAYLKYFTAAMACLAGLTCMTKRGERVFAKEFHELMLIALVFSVVSMFLMVRTGITSAAVLVELFKLVMPILLAYVLLNALDGETLYTSMVVVLIASIAGYLVTMAKGGVRPSDLLSASFVDSNSATESSSFAGIFLVLTLYFAFFRKNRLWVVLSALFCVFTFKRLALVFAIAALVISAAAPRLMTLHIRKTSITFLKVATIGAVALWAWLLLPGQEQIFISVFHKAPSVFTMGRSEAFRYLLSSGFQSYGFGSANEAVHNAFGMPFEMDLIKISLELF